MPTEQTRPGDRPILSSPGAIVRIVPSTGAELLLSLLHAGDPVAKKRFGEAEWWQKRAKAAGAAAVKPLRGLGQLGVINLLGLAFDAPDEVDGAGLLAYLDSLPPHEIVLTAAGAYRRTMRRQTNGDVIRAAVAGDRQAKAEFRDTTIDMPEWQRSVAFMLSRPADEVGSQVVDAVRRWYEVAFSERERDVGEAQRECLESLLAIRPTWTVDSLMASVLPGVDYVPAAAVEEVAFVPDVVIRPGLVFLDHRMMSIASFPVARAHESADQPPEQLVRLGKALGDELRLRALRILARGPISLGDLAAELGVPRTTLSHHIGVLRSAGLVTMGIDDGRWGRLRLRTDGIEQAPDTFRRYLAAEGDDDVVRRMR